MATMFSYVFQVTEVNSGGHPIRVFGCGYLDDVITLNYSNMQYAVLDDSGRAFVADSGNLRILLMTGQPPTERVITTMVVDPDEPKSTASRMCHVRTSGQLFVVMATRNRIVVHGINN